MRQNSSNLRKLVTNREIKHAKSVCMCDTADEEPGAERGGDLGSRREASHHGNADGSPPRMQGEKRKPGRRPR